MKANAESLCLPWMKAARARAMPTAAAEKPAWYPWCHRSQPVTRGETREPMLIDM